MWAAYGDNNRSCMLRLPRNRPAVENRGVDSAANTYLAAAFMLAAGLEGIAEGLDPGEPVEDITYDWTRTGPAGGDVAGTRLPRTLLEAVEAFEADPLTHEVFPAQFVAAYVDMKRGEWDEYHAQVTDWERAKYLLSLLIGDRLARRAGSPLVASGREPEDRYSVNRGYVDAVWAVGRGCRCSCRPARRRHRDARSSTLVGAHATASC